MKNNREKQKLIQWLIIFIIRIHEKNERIKLIEKYCWILKIIIRWWSHLLIRRLKTNKTMMINGRMNRMLYKKMNIMMNNYSRWIVVAWRLMIRAINRFDLLNKEEINLLFIWEGRIKITNFYMKKVILTTKYVLKQINFHWDLFYTSCLKYTLLTSKLLEKLIMILSTSHNSHQSIIYQFFFNPTLGLYNQNQWPFHIL